jgi:long-subunit fatty acid transport protein
VIWYTCNCATLTVVSCTGAWNLAGDVSYDGSTTWTLRRTLLYDCTGGRTKSFQNKVVADGFGVPRQTAYKTTKLCGQNPN